MRVTDFSSGISPFPLSFCDQKDKIDLNPLDILSKLFIWVYLLYDLKFFFGNRFNLFFYGEP